ncbi:hypothetical protein [Kushneria sp. EE4]
MSAADQPFTMSSSPPRFYFGIPLRARACAMNWAQVCSNLARTLDSLARQSRRDFRVLVSCHDIPDVDTRGLDIEFLTVDFPPPFDDSGRPGNDKHKKKHQLGLALGREVTDDVYYMALDADDLIHPALVETVLEDDNQRGYLIERGLMFNAATGHYRACGEDSRPFWRNCGSCAVVYFTADELPQSRRDKTRYYSRFQNHIRYVEVARDAGRPLTPFKEAMAVYVVNHGENDWTAYRCRADGKTRYIEARPIHQRYQIETLQTLFPQLEARKPGLWAHPLIRPFYRRLVKPGA